MRDELYNNEWVLVGIIYLGQIAWALMRYGLSFVVDHIPSPLLGVSLTAMCMGMYHAMKFNEKIPAYLRGKVALIWGISQVVINTAYCWMFGKSLIFWIMAMLVTLFVSGLIYLLMKYGSWSYLRKMAKKAAKSRSMINKKELDGI